MAGYTASTFSRQRSGPSGVISRQGHPPLKPQDVQTGLIAWLSDKARIPGHSRAITDNVLSARAWNHPCLIIELKTDNKFVFCLQVTSFGSGTIQDKYAECRNDQYRDRIFNDYIAFKEPGTVAHNQQGLLTYTGKPLEHQSYAHLEYGFWIEPRYLELPTFRKLDEDSLSTITDLYQQADDERRLFGTDSSLRLANAEQRQSRSASPPSSSALFVVSRRSNGPSAASRSWRVSSLTKRDFDTFDAGQQQSSSRQTISSPQRPAAVPRGWRRNNQNLPPSEAKRIAMESNWRTPQPVV